MMEYNEDGGARAQLLCYGQSLTFIETCKDGTEREKAGAARCPQHGLKWQMTWSFGVWLPFLCCVTKKNGLH